MPVIEKKALELARGKILDVGCGSGSHSLYLQNKGSMEVIALDISMGAISVAKKRGVTNVICKSIWDFKDGNFDTILLLMNGMGIGNTLEEVPRLLIILKHY